MKAAVTLAARDSSEDTHSLGSLINVLATIAMAAAVPRPIARVHFHKHPWNFIFIFILFYYYF
jgi:hypothetical protein